MEFCLNRRNSGYTAFILLYLFKERGSPAKDVYDESLFLTLTTVNSFLSLYFITNIGPQVYMCVVRELRYMNILDHEDVHF